MANIHFTLKKKENKMIGYKATYGGRCRNITYKIGKTYTFNGDLIMCHQGFHFCKELKDVFDYYGPEKNIEIYKIETLGSIINGENKSVTNKFRLVEKADFSEFIKFDQNNNLIYFKNNVGSENWYKYDQNGNKIYHKSVNDILSIIEYWYKYNQNNNLIYSESSYNEKYWYEYDENNNLIYYYSDEPYCGKYEQWCEYNENNNMIHSKDSRNYEKWYEYDKNNNMIHSKDSNICEHWFEYDKNNHAIHFEDGNGFKWWRKYDKNGNEIYYTDSNTCCEKHYSYDNENNVYCCKNFLGDKWSIEWSITTE